ncbi:oxygenase MpaB family protein [Roseomonas xinghualingensis]|uniref:oxygenase MpaB family protein n=1 Tax=Roseomonas xinghualingensis TaxID=2986475 RepID=UPI0021F18F23|nr:oxygenase MpaB family protein [Roseomonas sp. SXEYE001]MCV4205872.1 oxygenase MpaB family protein [Roseomonas sp. SXEYE001]
MTALILPAPLHRRIDATAQALLEAPGLPAIDFSQPPGEPALIPADSISWRIFRNPASLFIGGVAAVILELAEPRVRSGVWEHSSFRAEPVRRLQRTGLAAMVTVYGARSVAERMIAGVVRMHDKVTGNTPSGAAYRANDQDLLDWVQATASFGFTEAYSRYVRPLSAEERDHAFAEGVPASRLYGAVGAPTSDAEWQAMLESMRDRLEPSPIVFEFLAIMRDAPALPAPLRPVQRLLLRAAVEMTPGWVRDRLRLTARHGLRPWEKPAIRLIGRASDRIMLRASPAVQASLRLGLPADYLYR